MKIGKRIHALKIPFQIAEPAGRKVSRFVYVYLIHGRTISIIDSGVACAEKIIFDHLERHKRRAEEIKAQILTHSHADHMGAARALREASGCKIYAHAAEKAWFEDVELQSRERPVPGFSSLVGGSVLIDHFLQDGERLDLGDGLSLEAIHTPGHSSGSMSFWLPEEGALFCADAVPVPGDMPIFEDLGLSASSIRRLGSIAGIRFLLSAWADPREGPSAYRAMDQGMSYLRCVQDAALKAAEVKGLEDPLEHCRWALREMGLPESMANPLVARSFQASLRAERLPDSGQGTNP